MVALPTTSTLGVETDCESVGGGGGLLTVTGGDVALVAGTFAVAATVLGSTVGGGAGATTSGGAGGVELAAESSCNERTGSEPREEILGSSPATSTIGVVVLVVPLVASPFVAGGCVESAGIGMRELPSAGSTPIVSLYVGGCGDFVVGFGFAGCRSYRFVTTGAVTREGCGCRARKLRLAGSGRSAAG